MKLISNRKLYRLGQGVALFMTGFLVYFVYVEVSLTGLSDVTFRKHLTGYSNSNSSDIYDREIPANRIAPMGASPFSVSKKNHFKSAFRRQNGYDFISTDFDVKKSETATKTPTGLLKTKKDKFGLGDGELYKKSNIYSKSEFMRNELIQHSNKRPSPTRRGMAHSQSNKTINSLPTGKGSEIRNDEKLSNAFKRQPSPMYQNKTKIIQSPLANSKPHSALYLDQHSKKISMNNNDSNNSKNNSNSKSRNGEGISSTNRGKYLIYLCDPVGWCGGWGDRQRGIAGSYHLSKVLGRKYRIVMTTPCNLTGFYRPNRVDWLLKSNEIDPTMTKILISSISKLNFKDKLTTGNFNVKYPQDVIFIKTNQDLIKAAESNPLYSGMIRADKDMKSRKARLRSAWMDLMRPSDSILSKLQELVGADRLIKKGLLSKPLEVINKTVKHGPSKLHILSPLSSSSTRPLICAHVRMGKNPTIPMDEQFESFTQEDISKLLKFLHAKDTKNDAEFFLATDDQGIREQFIRFFGKRLIHYGGRIIHIDRQRDIADACEGFGVALLDQLVLSVCDQLVVSRSGFSIHASHLRNSSNPAYIMEEGVIKLLKV